MTGPILAVQLVGNLVKKSQMATFLQEKGIPEPLLTIGENLKDLEVTKETKMAEDGEMDLPVLAEDGTPHQVSKRYIFSKGILFFILHSKAAGKEDKVEEVALEAGEPKKENIREAANTTMGPLPDGIENPMTSIIPIGEADFLKEGQALTEPDQDKIPTYPNGLRRIFLMLIKRAAVLIRVENSVAILTKNPNELYI